VHVGKAVKDCHHLETAWPEAEMTKRIVGYLVKGTRATGIFEAHWKSASQSMIDGGMQGLSAACQEKAWFFEIDLSEAISRSVWEIIGGASQNDVTLEALHDYTAELYDSYIERTLLTKAMRKACEDTYESDTKLAAKMHKFLWATYEPALKNASSNNHGADTTSALKRVEDFTKAWMDTSMRRAWSAVQHDASVMTYRKLSKLWRSLVRPFGDDNSFSCISSKLTDAIGEVPPGDWAFISDTVKAMLARWKDEERAPADRGRRRRQGGRQDGDASMRDRSRSPGGMDIMDVGDGAAIVGHSECASAEDCLGNEMDRLIRHRLDGELRDIYCEACWLSFLSENAGLDGVCAVTGTDYKPA